MPNNKEATPCNQSRVDLISIVFILPVSEPKAQQLASLSWPGAGRQHFKKRSEGLYEFRNKWRRKNVVDRTAMGR
jgi:hypothetical protein